MRFVGRFSAVPFEALPIVGHQSGAEGPIGNRSKAIDIAIAVLQAELETCNAAYKLPQNGY